MLLNIVLLLTTADTEARLLGGRYSLSSHDRAETVLRLSYAVPYAVPSNRCRRICVLLQDRRVWHYYSQTPTPCVTLVAVMALALHRCLFASSHLNAYLFLSSLFSCRCSIDSISAI